MIVAVVALSFAVLILMSTTLVFFKLMKAAEQRERASERAFEALVEQYNRLGRKNGTMLFRATPGERVQLFRQKDQS